MRRITCVLLAVSLGASAVARAEPPAAGSPEPFLRATTAADGRRTLELSSRSYRRADGTGPTVTLVGAVHIADAAFYAAKQAELDGHDLVLFEGVRSTGMGDIPDSLDDAAKATATAKRMRFLAQLAVAARERCGSFAKDFESLARDSGRLGDYVSRSTADGWGRPIELEIVERPAEGAVPASQLARFRSLGADGAAGGEGLAADLVVDGDAIPVERRASRGGDGGNIQARLAKALGVAYQLDGIDSGKPNWRNSDMDVEEVRARLEQAGPDASMVLRLLEGNSLEARVAGVLISFLGASRTLSSVVKLMMIEQLSAAEEVFGGARGMKSLAAMQKVIIDDRNRVVLDDLKRIIDDERDLASIAIFYGAGHLPAFERSFRDELGLEPVGETWTAVMSIDPRETGMSPAQLRSMRRMLERSMGRSGGE
jgi:hypothetical protein